MVSGCTCLRNGVNHYKIGTGFKFVCRNITIGHMPGVYRILAAECKEISAYCGTQIVSDTTGSYLSNDATPGGIVEISDSSAGVMVKTSYVGGSNVVITPQDFCEITSIVNGSGSVSVGGTDYGKYRAAGESIPITITPASGYMIKSLYVNGSTVAGAEGKTAAYTHTIANLQDDVTVVASFAPAQYTITCNAVPSDVGEVAFKLNGQSVTVPFSAVVNDLIIATMTPAGSNKASAFGVNGDVYAASGIGANEFKFVIYERQSATYACNAIFAARPAIANTIAKSFDGGTVLVKANGEVVPVAQDGTYSAYEGNAYEVTAGVSSAYEGFADFAGWRNQYGELVSVANPFAWVQSAAQFHLTAAFDEKPLLENTLYVATSTSDYGSGSSAYVAGCRAEYSSTPLTKDDKFVPGVFVCETEAADGWAFSGVYLSRLDNSGARFYKANGASSVQFSCDFDAKVFAIFTNTAEPTTPEDQDQGNSVIATGAAAIGLRKWEGAATRMTMMWHSGRFISNKPMTISTARVYADGYATDGVGDTDLKVCLFESPSTTDGKVLAVKAKSQSAFRLPMRRPEKYIELEVTSPHTVSQIAVATSMEGLWQM